MPLCTTRWDMGYHSLYSALELTILFLPLVVIQKAATKEKKYL